MKKNIEYANINSSLLGWLIDKLKGASDDLQGSKELKNHLEELQNGKCSSLILEASDEVEERNFSDSIVYEEMEIIPKFRRVLVSGEEISLTPKEYDILYFLASNQGEIYTKEQIYKAVWDDEYLMDDSNIMSFIRKLRKKIEPNPDSPKFILTVWGIGYKFNDK